VIQRAFRYRLYPTPEQAETLAQFAGATRFVYNLALEQRTTFWRQYRAATGSSLNFISQGREVTELRRCVDWLAAVPAVPLLQCLRDLDRAYAAFFAGVARYPNHRRKGDHDSFRFREGDIVLRRLNKKWSAVRIPKLGWLKFRDTRAMRGRTVNATFSHRTGQWHVAFSCEIEHKNPTNNLPAIGIDRGVANTLALSSGEMLCITDTTRLERNRRRARHVLLRRKRGSSRYAKQRRRVARIASQIARARADWHHKATLSIAGRFGFAAIEGLKVVNMTAKGRGKRGLNRSILEQGWGAFERILTYKLEERGGTLIKVNPAFTSQQCSACGTIDRASRESQASFACRHCDFAIHADTNAAINILRRGTASMREEGSAYAPVEPRTMNHAA
jgi:putative transposase